MNLNVLSLDEIAKNIVEGNIKKDEFENFIQDEHKDLYYLKNIAILVEKYKVEKELYSSISNIYSQILS